LHQAAPRLEQLLREVCDDTVAHSAFTVFATIAEDAPADACALARGR